ncbi:MAG: Fur family transcriptional regulator [Lacunisphaera sp.]|nr:Fur family transcriptional regulator [Lacunisphaera sp.]
MSRGFEQQLRGAGLRVTHSRLRVLGALERMPHSSALALHAELGDEATSVQSVHNALVDLTDAHMLRRIEPAGSAALYELRVGDNHHHLVCSGCRAVVDVDCVVGEAPCLTPSDHAGFTVYSAEVTFWGLCSACSQANEKTDRTRTP